MYYGVGAFPFPCRRWKHELVQLITIGDWKIPLSRWAHFEKIYVLIGFIITAVTNLDFRLRDVVMQFRLALSIRQMFLFVWIYGDIRSGSFVANWTSIMHTDHHVVEYDAGFGGADHSLYISIPHLPAQKLEKRFYNAESRFSFFSAVSWCFEHFHSAGASALCIGVTKIGHLAYILSAMTYNIHFSFPLEIFLCAISGQKIEFIV